MPAFPGQQSRIPAATCVADTRATEAPEGCRTQWQCRRSLLKTTCMSRLGNVPIRPLRRLTTVVTSHVVSVLYRERRERDISTRPFHSKIAQMQVSPVFELPARKPVKVEQHDAPQSVKAARKPRSLAWRPPTRTQHALHGFRRSRGRDDIVALPTPLALLDDRRRAAG